MRLESHSFNGRVAAAKWCTVPLGGLLLGTFVLAALGCGEDGSSMLVSDASGPLAVTDAGASVHAGSEAGAAPPALADAGTGGADRSAPPRDAGERDAGGIATHDASAPVSAADAAAAKLDAGTATICPASSLNAGDHMQTLAHQGRNRSYLVHVPRSYTGTKPVALVLDLHGYSRTGASQKGGSGWDTLADREGIVVAYPDGVGNSWNVGGCCGSAGSGNSDDVGFARALVQKLSGLLCVDTRRVYASGVSNGAGMSARLGCDAADVFAGVALVSSDLRTMPCQPTRPVTEIAFRGTADTLEPYEGGLVGPPGMQFQSPGARGSFELWRNINRCSGMPVPTAKLCETYTQCSEGVEVTLCTLQGVGHSPYQNNLDFDIARTTWEAFLRVPAR